MSATLDYLLNAALEVHEEDVRLTVSKEIERRITTKPGEKHDDYNMALFHLSEWVKTKILETP